MPQANPAKVKEPEISPRTTANGTAVPVHDLPLLSMPNISIVHTLFRHMLVKQPPPEF